MHLSQEAEKWAALGLGGGGQSWRQQLWMWPLPLPEAGTLTFVGAWPGQGIDERSVSIDTSDLRRAAAEAQVVWPD